MLVKSSEGARENEDRKANRTRRLIIYGVLKWYKKDKVKLN